MWLTSSALLTPGDRATHRTKDVTSKLSKLDRAESIATRFERITANLVGTMPELALAFHGRGEARQLRDLRESLMLVVRTFC